MAKAQIYKDKILRPTEVGDDIHQFTLYTYSDKDKVSGKCRLSLFKISFPEGSTYQMHIAKCKPKDEDHINSFANDKMLFCLLEKFGRGRSIFHLSIQSRE